MTALLVAVVCLAGAMWLLRRWASAVDPDRCPIDGAIRQGWAECEGPCTQERPLPCRWPR